MEIIFKDRKMNWIEIKSLDELKELGTFKAVRNKIQEDAGPLVNMKCRGWNDLYNKVVIYKDVLEKAKELLPKPEPEVHEISEIPTTYFSSLSNEYIFYLLELDGDIRAKKLGITKAHYSNRTRARNWMNKIAKCIHPDQCNHPKADKAMAKLNALYKNMVKNG